MKILIVTQYFWPENFRINDLALGLVERGHEVEVLTGKPNYGKEGTYYQGYSFLGRGQEVWRGIPILRAPLVARGTGSKTLALNYLSFAFFGSLWGLYGCKKRYDAIFVYEISPVTVGLVSATVRWLNQAPVYFWVQDLWPESLSAAGGIKNPLILGAVDRLVRFIYNRCDQILISSEAFRPRIKAQGQPPEKIHYFPQWAEEDFKDSSIQLTEEDQAALPQGFKILYAGNIGEAQGFTTLLDAAERLKEHLEINWVIVGDGRLSEWVQKEVNKRGLESCFHLLGRKPLAQMPAYFKEAGALLVSLKKEEIFALTLPAKLQSYMAFGAPILAALDGAGADCVRASGAGLVAPAGDAETLAKRALELSKLTPEARQAMAQAGRQYAAQHFDRDQLLSQLEALLAKGMGA